MAWQAVVPPSPTAVSTVTDKDTSSTWSISEATLSREEALHTLASKCEVGWIWGGNPGAGQVPEWDCGTQEASRRR